MNIEEFKNIIDNEFGKYCRMLMFLAERGIATEKELTECFPKSAKTLNKALPQLIDLELIIKKRNIPKQKKYAHYIYISTPKLYDLIQYLSDCIAKITHRIQAISDTVKISEA